MLRNENPVTVGINISQYNTPIYSSNDPYPVLAEPNKYPINKVTPIPVTKQIKSSKTNSKCIIISIVVILILIVVVVAAIAIPIGIIFSKTCRYGKIGADCIECGLTYFGDKIIGGQVSTANSWPSVAYVRFQFYFNKNGQWYSQTGFCGGTLVNQDTVITAAHCYKKTVTLSDGSVITVTTNQFQKTIESMYTVHLGVHDRNDLSSAINASIKSYTLHPSYNSVNQLNDIAIIKLENKVNLNNFVQIACLPETTKKYPDKTDISAYVIGWGNTVTIGTVLSDKVKEAQITVYDSTKCSGVSVSNTKNWDTQICAGKYEGGVDTCQGDSGGPLFIKDSVDGKQKFILSGVTSYGQGCAQVGRPGIYTRVSPYIDWITEHMNS
ncbi:unnamed protein product [Brachionus calyciflorus]|uniref:Peptidase S1 domain-containing protein n=1 Tax=Brachionus calyciflorus TaxID=104777 RepID=A0A813V0A8_9BILA|nr:unnamed protein product [Brachionus calyciflorus]